MQIAIIGYGKMGREIESAALSRGHQVCLTIDQDNLYQLDPEHLGKADVAIEFTTPATAAENIKACFTAGVPVVSGTTGWTGKDEIEKLCRDQNQAFFYASNFSIGVNILFKLNQWLSGVMNKFPEYEIKLSEVHHVHKKDAPSGTAITLAEDILKGIDRKTRWVNEPSEKTDDLEVISERKGEVPGTHVITYESTSDILQVSHIASNRSVFAIGAIMAAEYLNGKSGIFNMDNLLDI